MFNTPENALISSIGILLSVVGMVIVAYLAKRYGSNENVQRAIKAGELLANQATDWIMTVRYGGVNLKDYNGVDYYEKSKNSPETLGRYFDARMLFVVDRVEESYFRATGRKAEFDDIWATAEKVYQLLNRADNGLDMNPEAAKRKELANRPDVVSQSTAAPAAQPSKRKVSEFVEDSRRGSLE